MATCKHCDREAKPNSAVCESCRDWSLVLGSRSFRLVVGVLVGGFVGFLFRPTNGLGQQVGLMTALLQGSNLEGLETILVPLAKDSFNLMLGGAFLGAVVGSLVGLFRAAR